VRRGGAHDLARRERRVLHGLQERVQDGQGNGEGSAERRPIAGKRLEKILVKFKLDDDQKALYPGEH